MLSSSGERPWLPAPCPPRCLPPCLPGHLPAYLVALLEQPAHKTDLSIPPTGRPPAGLSTADKGGRLPSMLSRGLLLPAGLTAIMYHAHTPVSPTCLVHPQEWGRWHLLAEGAWGLRLVAAQGQAWAG